MISSVSAWVLSIACIICISVLVELVLPSGQMNKYIKGIFSFVVLFVIISPVPKLLNMNIDGDVFLDYGNVQVDEDYIAQLNMDKLTSLTKSAEDAITELGYENSVVSLEADIFSISFKVKSATIDLSGLVITSSAKHKDIVSIREEITVLISTLLSLEKEEVYFE